MCFFISMTQKIMKFWFKLVKLKTVDTKKDQTNLVFTLKKIYRVLFAQICIFFGKIRKNHLRSCSLNTQQYFKYGSIVVNPASFC